MSGVQLSAPYALSVSWNPPDNSKKFDLDHFKVCIILPEQENCIANGTSMEPEYYFHSDSVMILPQNSIHVTVTTVNRCSQERLSGPLAVELNEINDKSVFTNVSDVVSKTENGCTKELLYMIDGNEKI